MAHSKCNPEGRIVPSEPTDAVVELQVVNGGVTRIYRVEDVVTEAIAWLDQGYALLRGPRGSISTLQCCSQTR